MIQLIEFQIRPELSGVVPEPKPAAHFLPDWFRNLPERNSGDDIAKGTVKRCVPAKDAMMAGYIIPLWADVRVFAKPDGRVDWGSGNSYENAVLAAHEPGQARGCPMQSEKFSDPALKFLNPWIIKTPPGYSCLFLPPMWHYEPRFQLLPGIVDTDVYYNCVNFPCFWKQQGETIVEVGTPLVQVIPFRRDNWKSEIGREIDTKKHGKSLLHLGTRVMNAYRHLFWQQQRFK